MDNRRQCINRARQAEARVRRLVNKNGIPLTARNLQTAIIQGTMLYAAELIWRGKKMESEYQISINRMGRATMSAFRTTPPGIVMAESKLTPTKPLLDYHQAKFMQRPMARPKGHQGPEEILER